MPAVTAQEPGNGTGTLSYTIPGNGLDVETVYATIDATGAGGAVTAEITIRDQSGVVIARKVQGSTIDAGVTGSATWALRLDDEGGGGSGGITEIDSSDGSINVSGGGIGPIVDLTTFEPRFSQNTGTVTFVAPGAANVPWTPFLGDTILDYTTPTVPTPLFAGWYAFSAFATFGPMAAGGASGDGTLTASGGYAPSPSSEAGGFGTDTFGLALAWSIPALRMKTTGGVVLGVDTDSATGCVVNAQLNVAFLRPD
jgi:hypothetical protein